MITITSELTMSSGLTASNTFGEASKYQIDRTPLQVIVLFQVWKDEASKIAGLDPLNVQNVNKGTANEAVFGQIIYKWSDVASIMNAQLTEPARILAIVEKYMTDLGLNYNVI